MHRYFIWDVVPMSDSCRNNVQSIISCYNFSKKKLCHHIVYVPKSIFVFMSVHPSLHPLQIDLSFEDNPTKHSWFAGAYWIDVENHINTHKPSSALKGSKRLVWQSVSWIAKPNAIKEKQLVQPIANWELGDKII